uniref:DDE Tnp4 domain-containing protein n=1 Tax=Amphimedon queenslandica TaxID=400682 RepID=A0A1X7VDC6_AMPQE
MFMNSKLNHLLQSKTIPPCPRQILEDYDPIPVFVIGDPAYHPLGYVIKEYANGGSMAKEHYFGYKLYSARIVIECSFGRLKGQFEALRHSMDINIEEFPYVIYCCFVLHNFCEFSNESVGEE